MIHHSSNTPQIVNEIHRILKPGGRVVFMVYHRSFWHYYVKYGFFRGVLRGDFFRFKSVHEIVQHHIDGAFARYYTTNELRELLGPRFRVERIPVYGMRQEVLVIFPGRVLKNIGRKIVPESITRVLTNTLRWGGMIVCDAVKL